jgi:SpoVK/Ycf46/Vps4 family AAA+-type ATPase
MPRQGIPSYHGQDTPRGAPKQASGTRSSSDDPIIGELESLGAQVIMPAGPAGKRVNWSSLGGYEMVKSQVEESIILGLKHPSLFERMISKTRSGNGGTNRPKVVLFQGPPGTGKTSTCKIIANETNVPMIHIPLESIVSKWFGESEKHVAKFYELGKEIARRYGYSGVILFIDEIDSLVSSRDIGSPHEASKRILSVLLRHIDGFDDLATKKKENDGSNINTMLICATNRPQDLDSAFLNRVDSSIEFALPDADSRKKILAMYAKHLGEKDIGELAEMTVGLSGRSLKDLCQSAERVWASQIIRGLKGEVGDDVEIVPPPVHVYLDEAKKKVHQQYHQPRMFRTIK